MAQKLCKGRTHDVLPKPPRGGLSCCTILRTHIVKQRWPCGQRCSFCKLAFVTHLSEALAAENGTIGLGLEGHLCLTAATGASSGEELTGATGVVLASVTASLAALGLVLEAALCVEFLLTGGENEFVAALFAN